MEDCGEQLVLRFKTACSMISQIRNMQRIKHLKQFRQKFWLGIKTHNNMK
jgi:hypothetical protein